MAKVLITIVNLACFITLSFILEIGTKPFVLSGHRGSSSSDFCGAGNTTWASQAAKETAEVTSI